ASLVPQQFSGYLDVRQPHLGVLPGSWYPAEILHALYDHYTANMSEAEWQKLARDIANAFCDRLLSGIYKAFVSILATPQRYAQNAQRLWDHTFDNGTLVVRVSANRADSVVSDWRSHHPIICAAGHLIGHNLFVA